MKKCVVFLMILSLSAAAPKPISVANALAAAGVGLAGASLGLQVAGGSGSSTRNAITLYQHSHHGGERITTKIYPGVCVNIPNFKDRASSVHTYDECFILWEHYNCRGKYHVVAPGRGCHFNLKDCGFNDETRAVQRCSN